MLVTALAVVTTLTLGPAAIADRGPHGDHPIPSRNQVDQAKAQVVHKAHDVASIRSALAGANQRLEAASTGAAIATEKYDAAMWKLGQARTALAKAERRATDAKRAVADQREGIASLVTQNYRGGMQIAQLNAMLQADGPAEAMDNFGAVHSAGDSMQARFDRYRAANALAKATAATAQRNRTTALHLAATAKSARERAAGAAAGARSQTTAIAAQKRRLIGQLASAQHVSYRLADRRQTGLEQRARARAEAAALKRQQARAKALAKQEAVQAKHQAALAKQRAAEAKQHPAQTNSQPTSPSTSRSTSPSTSPAPSPPPSPAPVSTPAPSGGASTAIGFAKAQLGEPYRWGAAGPSSWDCSGLMMRAWAAAGVSLPHFSGGQYAATQHLSSGQLRPGDLVFWGSSGSPSSIYHVAMYLGNGQIIQAPRTGRDVEIVSMYSWTAPNFFGRV